MGSELGLLHDDLCKELTWLHQKWGQFVVLFAHSPGRVEELNRVASFFFGVAQRVLFDDVIMNLARLTDAPRSRRRANVTLQRLPALVDTRIRSQVRRRLGQVVTKAGFVRDRRNRVLAHCDLRTRRDPRAAGLKPATKRAVDELLEKMADVMNLIDTHYLKVAWGYSLASPPGGAGILVSRLQRLDSEEHRQRGARFGDTPPK